MAYIQPNSVIYLCRGCELDANYNHTYWFATAAEQVAYFQSLVKPSESGTSYVLSNYTYQRVNKNTIRVGILADKLYDCNYMMFQNTSYGNKWFYAFIREVNYINDNTTEIVYSIDVMQTWMWDYKLGNSFVEREHADHDVIGDNVVPEQIGGGDLIVNGVDKYFYPQTVGGNRYVYFVMYLPNGRKHIEYNEEPDIGEAYWVWVNDTFSSGPSSPFWGNIVNGVYTPVLYVACPMDLNDTTLKIKLKELIDVIVEGQGAVINIMQVPADLYNQWNSHGYVEAAFGVLQPKGFIDTIHPQSSNPPYTYQYVPKNKKLFTYPYQQLVVSNNAGDSAEYRWEDFKNNDNDGYKYPIFYIDGTPFPSCEIMCFPTNYKGVNGRYYEAGIMLSNFPTPPWNEDSFARWWSVNKDSYITGLLTSAVDLASAYIVGSTSLAANATIAGTNPAPSNMANLAVQKTSLETNIVAGTVNTVLNSIATFKTAKNTPDTIHGQSAISTLATAQGRIGFSFYKMCIKAEAAEIIDKYFTMYGYATKLVKEPNVHVRERFTYTKTIGCVVHAKTNKGIPADVEEKIASIYDNGVTFWVNKPNDPTFVNEIGDYESPNTIIS